MPYKDLSPGTTSELAIVHTLLYSSIFEFPLSEEEIWQYLKSTTRFSKSIYESSLQKLLQKKNVVRIGPYYAIPHHKMQHTNRQMREKISRDKLQKATVIANKISTLPTILLIGISGSLALGNGTENDDIDLFIIVEKNTLWPTRFFIMLILALLGVRRSRTAQLAKDKICVNMIMSSDALQFEGKRRNIYTAHEIAQLKPLINRKNIFSTFINANSWIFHYMPNIPTQHPINDSSSGAIASLFRILLLNPLSNFVTKYIQKMYMQRVRTTEEVTDKLFAFHPHNHMDTVLLRYEELLRKYVRNT